MGFDSRTDTRLRLLADDSNRSVLTVLDDAGGSLHVEELAERLVARDVGIVSSAEYDRQLEQTVISLHHSRLPKLAEAGLVEYDPEANVAAYRESTSPEVEWHDAATIAELVAHLDTGPEAGTEGVGVIEGRERVVEYGRRLADEAEEELFCMYASTDLLEEECIRHGRDAIERGATMYVGSQNPAVRELSRQYLPEATVWEPQLDWLNTPTRPRVGRLVLVDRRKVMLAILEAPASDRDHPGETAVVADGEDHPLVVLVRELLGARLDHLDYQSDEFRSELHT